MLSYAGIFYEWLQYVFGVFYPQQLYIVMLYLGTYKYLLYNMYF